jgi:hypothetical protein
MSAYGPNVTSLLEAVEGAPVTTSDDAPSLQDSGDYIEKLASAIDFIVEMASSTPVEKTANEAKVMALVAQGLSPEEAVAKAYPGISDEQLNYYVMMIKGKLKKTAPAAPAADPKKSGAMPASNPEAGEAPMEKEASLLVTALTTGVETENLFASLLKEKLAENRRAAVEQEMAPYDDLLQQISTIAEDDESVSDEPVLVDSETGEDTEVASSSTDGLMEQLLQKASDRPNSAGEGLDMTNLLLNSIEGARA